MSACTQRIMNRLNDLRNDFEPIPNIMAYYAMYRLNLLDRLTYLQQTLYLIGNYAYTICMLVSTIMITIHINELLRDNNGPMAGIVDYLLEAQNDLQNRIYNRNPILVFPLNHRFQPQVELVHEEPLNVIPEEEPAISSLRF